MHGTSVLCQLFHNSVRLMDTFSVSVHTLSGGTQWNDEDTHYGDVFLLLLLLGDAPGY